MKLFKYALVLSCMAIMPLSQVQAKVTVVGQYEQWQSPSDDSVHRLMKVTRVEQSFQSQFLQSSDSSEQVFKDLFGETILGKNLTPYQKTQLNNIMADFGKQMMENINTPEFRQQLLNIYATNLKSTYTQSEVNAIIDFYSSELGQSIAAKQPLFDGKIVKQIAPISAQYNQKALKKLMPKLFKDMDALFKNTETK